MTDTTTRCPMCSSTPFELVLRLERIPVEEGRLEQNAAAAAAAPHGTVVLHHCGVCGLVYDLQPDKQVVLYNPSYSTFLGHSPTYARHVSETARSLVERYGVAGGTAVDIACGSGDFMVELLRAGMQRGVGIDPAAGDPPNDDITMIPKYFGPDLLPAGGADLVACRHAVYLLDDPLSLMRELRAALDERTRVVYLELMNCAEILHGDNPWDVTYEHACYFVRDSAIRMLELSGFEALDVRPCFDGHFLAVEARPAEIHAAAADWTSSSTELVGGLQRRADGRIAEWSAALSAVRDSGSRALAWCAGARAISFLTLTGAGTEIAGVVDVSPTRQGCYLPVSAHPVLPPAAVTELDPAAILVTNPRYLDEIRHDLAAMGKADLPVLAIDDHDGPEALVRAVSGR